MVAAELVRQNGDLLDRVVARLNATGVAGVKLDLDAAVARSERLMQRLDDAALEVRKKL